MKQIVSVKRMSINKVAESISAVLSHFTIFTYLTNTDCDDTICLLKKGMVNICQKLLWTTKESNFK